MKRCFKCHKDKPLVEFYRQKRMADGHLNKCKTCTIQDVRLYRKENIKSIREYDRERGKLPHRKERARQYMKTPQGKAAARRAVVNNRRRYPEKYAARYAVSNALKAGKLAKEPCERCGRLDVHGHHDDYAKPLDVRWLCPPCHFEEHYG